MVMLRGNAWLTCLGAFRCPTRFGLMPTRMLRSPRGPRVGSTFDERYSDVYSSNTFFTPTEFGAVRLDRNNVPLKHGEYEIKPKHHLADSDAAEPRVDTEGIIEKTVTKLPFTNEHGDLKDQETNSKKFQNESQDKIKKKRGRPRLEREISKADIRTVKKAQPVSPTEAEPKSAFEAVNKIRANLDSEEAKLAKAQIRLVDSQGFRLIKTEIEPPLNLMNHEQILQSLRRRVIVDTREVLVINKPYGMSMHSGGNISSSSKFALTSYLQELATFFQAEKLYTVHRLDKEVTGVLCLAKNRHMANVIETLFKAHQVKKEYLAVTKGLVKERQGTIELPIAVGHIGGKERMVIVPRPPPGSKKSIPKFSQIFEARTEYEIISWHNSAAYWKLRPLTGYKHQLRVHLGFGLRCPIIGDHKYSHIKKLVPQKLPGDILAKLHVRQQKVREIPLHLHSRSLVVPGILAGGRNLVARVNPPKHFQKTVEQLGLS